MVCPQVIKLANSETQVRSYILFHLLVLTEYFSCLNTMFAAALNTIVTFAVIFASVGKTSALPSTDISSVSVASASPGVAIVNATEIAPFRVNIGTNAHDWVAWVHGQTRCSGLAILSPVSITSLNDNTPTNGVGCAPMAS